MNKKKKILMVSCSQFGYHTDMLKYCEYLKDKYNIFYYCKNQKNIIIKKENINIKYIENSNNKILDRIKFLSDLKKYINNISPDYIIVDYFFLSSLIPFMERKAESIIDFRTGAISNSKSKNKIKNSIMSFESKFYKNSIVISDGLRKLLNISCKNTKVISLGANSQINLSSLNNKFKKELNLMYVGVLTGRRILDTLEGFKNFKEKNDIVCHYSIIGYGKDKKDEDEITDYIKNNNLEKYISFHGRIENNKLKSYFEKNNIGVSYIPLLDHYQVQPPTKTFEYLMNGMICIATNTLENKKVIHKDNGVLIEDNSESFYEGLEEIYRNIDNYDKKNIYKSIKKYSWENIVNELDKFLNTLGEKDV